LLGAAEIPGGESVMSRSVSCGVSDDPSVQSQVARLEDTFGQRHDCVLFVERLNGCLVLRLLLNQHHVSGVLAERSRTLAAASWGGASEYVGLLVSVRMQERQQAVSVSSLHDQLQAIRQQATTACERLVRGRRLPT
jgi:hypothetical protein